MSNIKWVLDPSHSEITFKVKHLMISTVTGHFNKFNLLAETATDDFSTAKKIEFSADTDSIDTNNEQRDGNVLLGDDIKINAEIQLVKQVVQSVEKEQIAELA